MGLRFRLRRAGEEQPPLWLGLVDAMWNQLALRLPAMVSEYGLHGGEPGDAETRK